MKETIAKLKSAVNSLENTNQHLVIFAIFLREDPLEKWDIIISAPWLSAEKMQSYSIVSEMLKEY
jgi:hypothetical protein